MKDNNRVDDIADRNAKEIFDSIQEGNSCVIFVLKRTGEDYAYGKCAINIKLSDLLQMAHCLSEIMEKILAKMSGNTHRSPWK